MAVTAHTMKIAEVLVIEDNRDHRDLIGEAFEDAGLTNPIRVAATAEDARTYLAECAQYASANGDGLPCVILLDIELPDASGLELLSEIRRNPALTGVPVVMLTTTNDTEAVNQAYQSGANSYLVKPIRFEDFYRMVAEAGLYWALLNQPYQP